MPIIPVRALAEKGILRDPNPYQLDLNAWSAGSNVRFHANKAERAPIFRTVQDALPEEPIFCVGREPSTGYDTVTIAGADGRLFSYVSGTLTDVSAMGLATPTIIVPGTGYSSGSPPSVTFSAPSVSGGRAAVGTAVVGGSGTVTAITVTDAGFYPIGSAVPTITIAPPTSGTTATANVTFAWQPQTDPRAMTACFLGDVQYINRPNVAPQWFGPESSEFAVLPNMDSAWTCRSLRVFGDYLVAMNVTKPAPIGSIPSLFKWSDLTLAGQVPGSWNYADPTTNAGENPLEQATTPLVDGLTMRGAFIVYSENAVFAVNQIDSNNIFAFNQVFSDGGMIAPNCGVEVGGIHYVFGPKDIYKHDGITKLSIIDKRNKDFVFRNMNIKLSEVCFAAYSEQYDCVIFAYNTGDPSAAFQGCDRCNQGAVYDLGSDTWSFIDLPNVSAMSVANLDSILTYANCPSTLTYANAGGSYYDQQNTFVKSLVAVSGAVTGLFTNSRLAAYDFKNKGSLAFMYEPEMNAPALLERTGIDLDQVGSDLTTYKKIRRVFPLVSIFDNVDVNVQLGGSNMPSGAVVWGSLLPFDPATDYKVDAIVGGRYLALRFLVPQDADFEVAGYDLDVSNGGRR